MATWEEQEAAHNEALDKIEQLEAEVESWKNSYKRAVAEGAELIRKANEEAATDEPERYDY